MSELFWVDLETTGLDPAQDDIIELGITSTNEDLEILTQRSWVITLDDAGLARMSPEVLTMHGSSGLLAEARKSNYDAQRIQREALRFLQGMRSGQSPMCGSTVHFDRAFLRSNMRELHDWFHYRNIDVSTVKNLARIWYPNMPEIAGRGLHRATPDIEDSIAELRHYRECVFAPPIVVLGDDGRPLGATGTAMAAQAWQDRDLKR